MKIQIEFVIEMQKAIFVIAFCIFMLWNINRYIAENRWIFSHPRLKLIIIIKNFLLYIFNNEKNLYCVKCPLYNIYYSSIMNVYFFKYKGENHQWENLLKF